MGVKSHTPVIIAANHPTAFIDPIFFCIFFDPPVYNMTRGDIFQKPFFRKLLESANMFPVYRQRDGYDGRGKNDEVFDYCRQKLQSRVAVNIFVEGEHHLSKQVLPAHKGFARVAFGTYAIDPMEDLQIVPVGCNYYNGAQTRDEAKIVTGKPLFVKDYWEAYQKNPAAAINQLCRDVEKALKEICYHVEDPLDFDLADHLLQISRNQNPVSPLPVVEHHAKPFWHEKAMLNRLNIMPAEEKAKLANQVSNYFNALEKAGLTDESLIQPEQSGISRLALLMLMAPFALVGYIIGWPVRYFIYGITKEKVKKKEFYTSALMGMAVLLGLIYFGIWMVTGLLTGSSWILTLGILMPILAWISIFWKETRLRWYMSLKANKHPERSSLLDMRRAINEMIPA